MSATALLKAPTVASVSPLNPSPPRMSATATMAAPAVSLSTTITVPRMTATGSMAVPVVSNAVNAAVTAPRMAATAAMPVPAVSVWGDIAPARMAATGAMAVPVVNTSSGVNFSDSFNRANASTLGASWITDPYLSTSLSIASNAATTAGAGLGANVYSLPMATGNNQITLVMKGTPATAEGLNLYTRLNAADTGGASAGVYLSMSQADIWTLGRFQGDSGVSTSGNQSWADGDTIVFTCVGATLTVTRNGSTVLTTGGATDLAAGYMSVTIFAATAGIDSFAAQDI